jgi:signal transduction histidine kinase
MANEEDTRVSILLVDDQPARLLSYEAILAPLGERLVFARSGREALQLLIREDFAAIVLDVNMPDIDGFETASLIHQHPRHERTPIIFVTAVHVTDLDQLRGYELGAVDYVYVPVVPQILRTKIQVLSEICRQRRQLERLNDRLAGANEELARANTSLQAEKARELESLNADLASANAELARTNATLAQEVEERRQAEARLQEADRRKDEFLATLAHELRNPLAPLRSALEVMSRSPGEEIVGQMRAMMQRQVKHMVRLVDDLLDVSRISRNVLELRREWVELGGVVDVAVETARPLVERREHVLLADVQAREAIVWVDAARIAQVIANLLNNAAKYTPPRGTIALHAALEPRGLVVSVRDTGVGLSPELQRRVFDLFEQGPACKESRDGLGIGLTLVKRLVELHGGDVTVRSDGEGCGSEFEVCVPVPQRVDLVPAAPAPEPVPSVGGTRVLVVDDNRDAAVALASFLSAEGHAATVVHSGHEAVRYALQLRPDVVILDLGMPDVDGYEAARRIRAAVSPPPLLVAVSGWGQEDDRRHSAAAGFDHHLVKPADGTEVVGLIDAACRRSPPDGGTRVAGTIA